MKTILIPIDYSPHADNAVRYAMQLATIIGAELHLCHSIAIPDLDPIMGFVPWQLNDYDALKANADQAMRNYIDEVSKAENFNLSITFTNEIKPVKTMLADLVEDKEICLIIMGISGAGFIEKFIFGSTSGSIIDRPMVPVLLLPKKSIYRSLKKIAFATDLSHTDLNSINDLTNLFSVYNPEILLTHVNRKDSDFHDPDSESNQFLNRVTANINYAKIYYRHLKEDNIESGLTWLTQHAQIDMLCMIHRQQHNFFTQLFKSSHTKKMKGVIELPLLVMPEVPW